MEKKSYGNNFRRKGYGRIFVEKEEDILKVKEAIKKIDEYELSYLGEDLITVWKGSAKDVVYTHKFEACIDALTEECRNNGIFIFCVSYSLKF